MNTDRGGRSLTKRLAKAIVAVSISVAGAAGLSAPASAQFWGGGWFAPIPMPGPVVVDPASAIPVHMVARIVAAQGFRLTDYPVRRGNRVIALGVDGRGQMMRFVIDAYDGAVLRTSLVGAPRPPGYIGNPDAYAYGGPAPDVREPFESAPKPKKKPRAKTAAKHPAPLPQAAPASPAVPPSQATQPPAPVAPAAAPATVSTPPAAPAVVPPVATPAKPAEPAPPIVAAPPPDVRPAPDAQPSADIGPKVVPVKPTEAKAPEPEAWDTEAQPKTPNVTPDQANTMPPERHEDK